MSKDVRAQRAREQLKPQVVTCRRCKRGVWAYQQFRGVCWFCRGKEWK